MALEPAKLSDFQMGGPLGIGTTARVYEAMHTATGRSVAIKVMEDSNPTGEMRERFAREALLLAGVESRHVGKILGFGFEKGQPFLVLERLTGETLDAKLRREGPVPLRIAGRWIEQLLVGVRDCHDANIIHRDIKPSNIFLHREAGSDRDEALDGSTENVKLIDFGVARLWEIAGRDMGGLTSANHLIGSTGYMAPEQFKSPKTVGYPADLYAVGVVIFRMLTGRLPFVSRSPEALIKMKSENFAPAISSTGTLQNPRLDWFVQKAMTREPETRFQSAREMLTQWWSLASTFDDDGATAVMHSVGPGDASHENPLREQPAPSSETRPYPQPPLANSDDGVNPFEIPTRTNPDLHKLVERELELQKNRKRGG